MLRDPLVKDLWAGYNPTVIHELKHAYALKTRSELDMDSGKLNKKTKLKSDEFSKIY